MNLSKYIVLLLLLGCVSCQDFHVHLVGDRVLAEVGDNKLTLSDLSVVMPKEYRDADSAVFAEIFIDKWIGKQVKLREAERIFFSSEADIEAMVEEYRQLLLIKKLDDRCVSESTDTVYTEQQISQYYNNNASNFRLNRPIVKGEVLRVPLKADQSKTLSELMGSDSQAKRDDFLSLCEKNDFEFTDMTTSWFEASELLDLLPLVRSDEFDKLLSQRGVRTMSDSEFDYFYQVTDYKRSGDVAPLEWVRSTIRTILITERQQSIIRENEQDLYGKALIEGVIKRHNQSNNEKLE